MQISNLVKTASSMIKSYSPVELLLLAFFIIYLIFPIQMPDLVSSTIDSPLGMLTMFIVAVYLFFNANPILAVVYVFVAYELLRRSAQFTGRTTIINYTPSQIKKDIQMVAMNPVQKETLEEQIVDKMAPIGHSDMSVYKTSEYKPIAENVGSASLF